ncbi:hypothetical protein M5K25_016346 [Dendrobium thyrsiflorum]|uniref:Uncharacterized protein n=1 Tax=Dendrobium thyrsiflorum TaxID=117978 RepID=A0ABD0UJA1_DENTH
MADDNPCNLIQASATNGVLEGEEQALLFLDSLDGYLMLLDSLSSSLRQLSNDGKHPMSMLGGAWHGNPLPLPVGLPMAVAIPDGLLPVGLPVDVSCPGWPAAWWSSRGCSLSLLAAFVW